MIKYTILYKNGKTWNGKAEKVEDIPIVSCTALFFKQTNITKVYIPSAGYGLRRWSYRFNLGGNEPRKPNPASITKKQKAFDKAYARWIEMQADLNQGRRLDISIKAYKKWLWEQKQKQAGPDGWIPWYGGEYSKCPLPYNTQVEVKFRCGDTNDTLPAGDWDWGGGDGGHVIVAYRLLGEENKPVKYSEPKKAPIKVTYTFWLGAFGEID
jgi:hypothetical protein